MECIFLNSAGQTLFVRGDLESGHWVQQEMNVTADFPFVADKKIERGMRIAFRSPVDDTLQVFEVRIVTIQEPEHFQQITAENIALSELSDEHIDSQQLTDQTAAQALATALTGTLWSVGNNTSTGTQSADFSRGSVWDAVNTIKQNWNVFITPRVVISSAGAITGRYLDIAPAQGVFRGLRLAVRKNLLDPAVTYDDEDVYTAMYGYGGNVDKPQAGGDDTTEELTFADVVWTATADHPAKPAGQTYLEDPAKTALYGRNGRPRFGYYQNGNIKDAGVLLEKTWESLKLSSTPKLSVAGTVVDLYRLGYHDEPIQLNDLAIVEIEETGELFQKQIICCDIDLVDPTGSRVEIGDYIPNIIYINRETDKKASGGGGGGGGRGSMTNLEDDEIKAWTEFYNTGRRVGMIVKTKNGDDYIDAPQITLAINESGEPGAYTTEAYIKADHINISATNTVQTLAGEMEVDANGNLIIKDGAGFKARVGQAEFGIYNENNLTAGVIVQKINDSSGQTLATVNADHINVSATSTVSTLAGQMETDANGKLIIKSAGGMYVQRTESGTTAQFGVWDSGNLTGGVMVQQINGQTAVKIMGGSLDIDSLVTTINSSQVQINAERTTIAAFLAANTVTMGSLTVTNATELNGLDCGNIDCTRLNANTGSVIGGTGDFDSLTVGSNSATWKTYVARYIVLSSQHYFLYGTGGTTATGSVNGYVGTTYENTTLHYLGY